MTTRSIWQSHFDGAFPDGLIMTWDGDSHSQCYPVPRVEVLAITDDGIAPIVRLNVPAYQRGFAFRVCSYTVIREYPSLVRVVGEDLFCPMLWDADVPEPVPDDPYESEDTDEDTGDDDTGDDETGDDDTDN